MLHTPFYRFQESAGAHFLNYEYAPYELPSYFDAIESEYDALRNSAAFVDFSFLGRLRLAGKDALGLLHRLSTNDLRNLLPLQRAVSVLTSEKGRIMDLVTIDHCSDHVLMITSAQNQVPIAKWLDKYTITDIVVTKDVTDTTLQVRILGPKSPEAVNLMFKIDSAQLQPNQLSETRIGHHEILIARSDYLNETGFDVIADIAAAETLFSASKNSGLQFCGMEACEIARVEDGKPVFRRELSDKYNPLEAGLTDAVSFTKGCYIGQEVIARLDSYQKVQRHLVQLRLSGQPMEENKILFQGKEIGTVTSCVRSIKHNGFIGLGYVKTEFSTSGEIFDVTDSSKMTRAQLLSMKTPEFA